MSHPPYRVAPEWAPHKAMWTAWPSWPEFWGEPYERARAEVAAMVRALADGDERVRVLADGREAVASAKLAIGGKAEVIDAHFGDVWMRDIGPIFAEGGRALGFNYNGWGGKFIMAGDEGVAEIISGLSETPLTRFDYILEGGALDMDGEGTLLTTRQCVINPNRNPGWDEEKAEAALKSAFALQKIIWLDEGMAGDHTDGHIDNIARFVGPGRVVCQIANGDDDPNADVFEEIALTLAAQRDAQGRKLEVIRIPSPGRVEDEDGDPVPASHMNFIIGNGVVVVPVYNGAGADAVAALKPLFPGRRVIGLSANALLTGGGAFHCITQQEPA